MARMPTPLESAIVRIRSTGDRVVGMGFLAGRRHVLTCAHVVTSALGIPDETPRPPEGEIRLDFPFIASGQMFPASVIFWKPVQTEENECPPEEEDIAGLQLQTDLPADIRPLELIQAEDLWNHPFRAFGYPEHSEDGVWAFGTLRGHHTDDWVRIEEAHPADYFIAQGFSGSPVWDEQLQGVVGMVVATDRQSRVRVAFMIPGNVLLRTWPDLNRLQGGA